jgi:Tol biopolymer transport system component
MVAFVNGDGAAFIRVYEYGVGLRGRSTSGQAPRWSPLGDHIAYVDEFGGHIRLLDPTDGSSTVLTPDSVSYAPSPVSWSPDGSWLIARRATGSWDLIRLSDALILPLPTLGDLREVAFRP